ncbi:MAG: hypothetical protein ACRDRH_02395 [Pseudonocardia sp.]
MQTLLFAYLHHAKSFVFITTVWHRLFFVVMPNCWHMDLETARNRLRPAGAEYQKARARFEDARDQLQAAVKDALRAGLRPKEIVSLSGYTRERVRQIARSIGIEPYF